MAQAQRLPGPSWISLVYVIELIFIIKNVNDFATCGKEGH